MMRVAHALTGVALCAVLVAAPAEAGWELVAASTPVADATDVIETRWEQARPPGGPHDRIRLHRYRGGGPAKTALLYLPGTNMNGVVAVPSEDHNLWIFLARRGVEVYALDYRTHFVPNSARAGELDFMQGWTLEAFVQDARAAADLARAESGRPSLFVAGFSRGATLAYALASVEPAGSVAGIVILDGGFKSPQPKRAFDFDAAKQKLAESGRWASDVSGRLGWENRHLLMSAAASDPGGPALGPGFETVGAQVSSILFKAWGPGGLADPHEQSRVEILARLLDGYDRYYPTIQNVESRSISDHEDDPRTALDDAWGEFEMPVIYFGSTGMGERFSGGGVYSARESGSDDVTIHMLEGYGHLDVLVGEGSREAVFSPALEWLEKRTP